MGHGGESGFRFSPAAASDLEQLVELRIAAMRESLERIGRFDPVRARRRMVEQFRPEHTRLIWRGEALAGCVAFGPDGPGWLRLEHFYIHPDRQGAGLGAEVLSALLAESDAQALAVRLTVLRESAANRFYARHGFTETGRDEVDIFYERPPA
ncbi:MAG: GNAT family N-acetyltransferase [Phenylobacterium sp.]|uniref:GNAT family N-acetyltransferase n=1 Tax=Phenylobacterium sp. TaxID=1871053 RepID=UPI002733E54F|nr:GNAT family N-acetyltransferase [Phenylobacterium sp.]MDP3749189.1 GNAT family N-acetyltransferase [Phenylobacterium sp.]